MPNVKVFIQDRGVIEAFNLLLAIGEDPRPALDPVGRVLEERVREKR